MSKPRILVVSPDVVGKKMAGPGMRYTEVSHQLAKWYDVTLAIPKDSTTLKAEHLFTIKKYDELRDITTIVKGFDFIFAQSLTYEIASAAINAKCRIIYDLYNPLPIEALVGNIPTTPAGLAKKDSDYYELLNQLLLFSRSGSYFVCANERQRDFWIGYLAANRIFMPSRYHGQHIEELIGLLPFGMQDADPVHKHTVLRGAKKNINDDSFVLLWAGGIWDWFDPLTAIKGMKKMEETYPRVKLVFLGTTHPNKIVGRMSMTEQAIRLSKKLGLTDKSVFFIEGWTDYHERANYLLEADVAVSLHKESLETRLSFRTRILDHFWASLPSIVTTGDWFAELIKKEILGTVIGYDDVDGFIEAVKELHDKQARISIKDNLASVREGFKWSRLVSGDLRSYIDGAVNSQDYLNHSVLNPYIDFASIGMLKEDSARLKEITDEITKQNSSPVHQRAYRAVKNKFQHRL